jgi:chromosome segregation ATPase
MSKDMPRRNDDLLDTPSIVPDTDARSTQRSSASTRPTTPRSSNSTAPSASAGMLRQLLLIGMLLGLGATCAFLYFQNQQQLGLNQQLQNRLTTVESQLGLSAPANTAGGETLGSKVKSLDDNLKTANDEIRKLWAVTNDKNIKLLENHTAQLTSQDKTLTTLQSTVTEMKKSVAMVEKTAGEANRQAIESNKAISSTGPVIAEMRTSLGALQQRIAQGDPAAREASQQAAIAQEQAEELQKKLDGLSKRVTDHDDAIKSIDTFRRSVNSDLGKLKQPNTNSGYTP